MQRFKRPKEPAGFSDDVAEEKAAVSACFNPPPGGTATKPEFPEKWKAYKPYFGRAQKGKCGYCEVDVLSNQYGDVEHFYPKSEVRHLSDDPATWGRDDQWAATVPGRSPVMVCPSGYWWLAYDWSNYLLSCLVCNRPWKGAIFPVSEDPRANPPAQGITETPLLLNPFDGQDPADHLRFTDLGEIEARNGSLYGLATIRTCGLDREGLRRVRKHIAVQVYDLITIIGDKTRSVDRIAEAYADLERLGNWERPHSGMVRAIYEEWSGIKWGSRFGLDPEDQDPEELVKPKRKRTAKAPSAKPRAKPRKT